MNNRNRAITGVILVLVVVIAAWSKMRHLDEAVYASEGRRPISEHPAFRKD